MIDVTQFEYMDRHLAFHLIREAVREASVVMHPAGITEAMTTIEVVVAKLASQRAVDSQRNQVNPFRSAVGVAGSKGGCVRGEPFRYGDALRDRRPDAGVAAAPSEAQWATGAAFGAKDATTESLLQFAWGNLTEAQQEEVRALARSLTTVQASQAAFGKPSP